MSAQTISSTIPTQRRGSAVAVRPARTADLPALAQLLVRCSPMTRLGWYGRGGGVLPLALQESWLAEEGGLVVEAAPGRLVAVAALRPATCTGVDDPIASSVEVMVHDGWQGRGIGTALLSQMAVTSLEAGRTELQLSPVVDETAGERLLTHLATRMGARPRGQRHDHGRCPRVHLSARALGVLTSSIPTPDRTGAWSLTVDHRARVHTA